MKKLLLTLALVVAAVPFTQARKIASQHLSLITPEMKAPVINAATAKALRAPSRADEGYTIDFCGTPYTWYSLLNGTTLNATTTNYVYIPGEVATKLAGNKITHIAFSAYLDSKVKSRPGSIFVSEDIEGEPVTSTDVTVYPVDPEAFEPQVEALEQPYEIKAGQGFYMGYVVAKHTNKDYPICVCETGGNMFSGYSITTNNKGAKLQEAYWEEEGVSLFIKAKTEGPVKNLSDFALFGDAIIDDYTLPTLKPGDTQEMVFDISNLGENEISTITGYFSIGDKKYPAEEIDIASSSEEGAALASLSADLIHIETPALVEGRNDIVFHVTKVGASAVDEEIPVPAIAVAEAEAFPRKFVVEEGTGTWCGWCPLGIDGMEYMEQIAPDRFIGIAVHAGDEMMVDSYLPVVYAYPGFPYCFINRDMYWNMQPFRVNFEQFYPAYWINAISGANVEVAAAVDEEGIYATATTTFAYNQDGGAGYAIAFVITEDGYVAEQTNYLSGVTEAQLGLPVPEFWQAAADKVEWTYTDTARDIFDCIGIEGSIPAKIVKGQPNKYSTHLSLDNVVDVNKTAVTALLIDNVTGVIMNAARVKADKYTAGVQTVIADKAGAKVSAQSGRIHIDGGASAIYTPAGMLVSKTSASSADVAVAPGLYIVRAGGKAHKVIVK